MGGGSSADNDDREIVGLRNQAAEQLQVIGLFHRSLTPNTSPYDYQPRIFSVASVSLRVCLFCQGSNFWMFWPANIIFGMRYIFRISTSRSTINLSRSRGQGQSQLNAHARVVCHRLKDNHVNNSNNNNNNNNLKIIIIITIMSFVQWLLRRLVRWGMMHNFSWQRLAAEQRSAQPIRGKASSSSSS